MVFVFVVFVLLFFLIIVSPIMSLTMSKQANRVAEKCKSQIRDLSHRIDRIEQEYHQASFASATPTAALTPKLAQTEEQTSPSTTWGSDSTHPNHEGTGSESFDTGISYPETQTLPTAGPALKEPEKPEKSTGDTPLKPVMESLKTSPPKKSQANPYEDVATVTPSMEPESPVKESFELRLGTYWFVRIGVLLLLSGLGFLAYTKREFFFNLSPEARVTGFYAFSLLLSAAGWWIQRLDIKLRNYGHVLMAGGFAGIYFTTYAAHVFEPVLVFHNQSFVIGLLLFWSACLFYYSNRVQSETIAVFATCASYFATYLPFLHASTTAPWVILISNLILATTSVVFLLKNKWLRLSSVSMIASYSGMAFSLARLGSELELTLILSIAILWLLFTITIFVSRNQSFNDRARASFAAVNNVTAVTLIGLVVWSSESIAVWQFSLVSGVTLYVCFAALPMMQRNASLTSNSYLCQSLLLVNFGWASMQLTSSFLGPIIALETVLLLVMARAKRDRFIVGLCTLAAFVAIGFTVSELAQLASSAFLASLCVAGLLLIGGTILAGSERFGKSILRPKVSAFTLFSVFTVTTGILFQISGHFISPWVPQILVAIPFVFLATYSLHRIPEFAFFWSLVGLVGIALGAPQILENGLTIKSLILGALVICQMHLWKGMFVDHDQTDSKKNQVRGFRLAGEMGTAIGIVVLILAANLSYFYDADAHVFSRSLAESGWLSPMLAISSIGVALYGRVFNAIWVIVASQFLLLLASISLIRLGMFAPESSHAWLSLIPVLSPIVHSLLLSGTAKRTTFQVAADKLLLSMSAVYSSMLAIQASVWVYCHIPSIYHVAWLALMTIGLFLYNQRFHRGAMQWQATLCVFITVIGYLAQIVNQTLAWPSLIALFGVMVFQQLAKLHPETIRISQQIHKGVISVCSILLFLSVTVESNRIHLDEFFHSFTLVWTWLGAAFLLAGLWRRERIYRLMGLTVWAFALMSLAPAFLGMSTEMKIASTFIMGSVFILFGFFYTRYKEQIRDLI